MLKCLLVHTRTEEQSPNTYLLLKVCFFCLSPLVKSSNRHNSFVKYPTHRVVVVMIWQNNKEFLMRSLLEHVSAIHNYVIFVGSV